MKLKFNFIFVFIALTTSCTKYKIIERNPEFADGGGSGTLSSGCSGTLQSCTLRPTSQIMTVGSTLQFYAVGKFSNSETLCAISPNLWSSSDITIASIDSNGLATALLGGDVNIQASLNSVQCTQGQLTVQYASCPTIISAQAIDAVSPNQGCTSNPLSWVNMVEIDIQFSDPTVFTQCTISDKSFVTYGGGTTCSAI